MSYLRTGSLAVMLSLAAVPVAHAETDARDYEAPVFLPAGSTVTNTYVRHVTSSDKLELVENQALFRVSHIMKFGQLLVVPFDAFLPIADVTVFAPTGMPGLTTAVNSSGLGDFTYLPSIGYFLPQDPLNHTYFGLTTYITAPTGSYKNTRPLNIGGNRWTFEPQLGVGQRFLDIFTAELVANVTLYGSNDQIEIPLAGRQTLKQEATYGVEAHVAADLSPTFYTGFDYYFRSDGRNHVEVGGSDIQLAPSDHVHSLRYNFGIRIEKTSLLLLQFQEDLGATGNASLGRFVGMRFSHVL